MAVPKAETPRYLFPDRSSAQIEVLGAGQQVGAYGIHPDTLAEYEWPDSGPDIVPLIDLPMPDVAAEQCFLAATEVLFRNAGGQTQAEIAAAQKAAQTGSPSNLRAPIAIAARTADGTASATSFFRRVNDAALRDIEPWFKRLFPSGYWQPNATKPPGAWRVTSADLGRGLEEDLSVHSTEGGHDFGTR